MPSALPFRSSAARRARTAVRLSMPALLLVLALAAAGCALEPAESRERTAQQLGLGTGSAATVRATGDWTYDGPAEADCGPTSAGHQTGFALALHPDGAPEAVVRVAVPHFHGGGDHPEEAMIAVERLAADGALAVSRGSAEVRLDDAAHRAGSHAVSAIVAGRYAGAAGSGELTAEAVRCFYFD